MTPESQVRARPPLTWVRGTSVLLGVVLSLLLTLHFFSERAAVSDHRPNRIAGAAAIADVAAGPVDRAAEPVTSTVTLTASRVPAGGDTHQLIADCALLLAALLTFLLMRATASTWRPDPRQALGAVVVRGPPVPRLRLLLCIARV